MFSSHITSRLASTGMHKRWVKMISKTLYQTLLLWVTAGSLSPWPVSTWMPLSVKCLPRITKRQVCSLLFSTSNGRRNPRESTNYSIKNGRVPTSKIARLNLHRTIAQAHYQTRRAAVQLRINSLMTAARVKNIYIIERELIAMYI